MTVINGIEIDFIQYEQNIIKTSIKNNEPIEDKLHVIIVISNPCQYAKRYILAKEFIKRTEMEESNVNLYIVELAYNDQKYYLTSPTNKNHLQLHSNKPIWHKESMINVGVSKLLPVNWKAMAWIDADIEFESPTWALDTLKILNGSKDIVQLFSHAVDMDNNKLAMSIFNSFGYMYCKGNKYSTCGINHWHPGFAWACTRKAYDKLGGLYDAAILGSGDHIMALSLINMGLNSITSQSTDNYKESILSFQDNCKSLRLGYVPGVIRHYFHGSKKNRKYTERWQILVKYDYSPILHITKDNNGLIKPTESFPSGLLFDIMQYFIERNEDE